MSKPMFSSDWLKEWREFSRLFTIAERGRAKPMNSRSTSVENCDLSVSVVRHVTDYRSLLTIKPTRLVTRVFPRFWRFLVFEFSLALCDIFLCSDWLLWLLRFCPNDTRSKSTPMLLCTFPSFNYFVSSFFFFLECGRGKSYRSRLLFIDICKFIMELFSRRFFKENFFEFLLELGSVSI